MRFNQCEPMRDSRSESDSAYGLAVERRGRADYVWRTWRNLRRGTAVGGLGGTAEAASDGLAGKAVSTTGDGCCAGWPPSAAGARCDRPEQSGRRVPAG